MIKIFIKKSGQKGFTLIELMIVIAIIGILAAIALPQFSRYRESGYVASMKADVNSIRNAEEAFFNVDNGGTYTSTLTDLNNFGFKGYSFGNSATVTIAPVTPATYTVVVTSSMTSKTVTYDSSTGQTTVSG